MPEHAVGVYCGEPCCRHAQHPEKLAEVRDGVIEIRDRRNRQIHRARIALTPQPPRGDTPSRSPREF